MVDHEHYMEVTLNKGRPPETKSKSRDMDVIAAQLRSGHCMALRSYAHRIDKEDEPYCTHCGGGTIHDWKHIVLSCPRWFTQRLATIGINGLNLNEDTLLEFYKRIGLPGGRLY